MTIRQQIGLYDDVLTRPRISQDIDHDRLAELHFRRRPDVFSSEIEYCLRLSPSS